MSFLVILLTSIDILYNPNPLDWMLVSNDEVARILDIYFPPEVLRNMSRDQYIYYGNAIINYYETRNATIFLFIAILMCYK
jgi:hypothetical protein